MLPPWPLEALWPEAPLAAADTAPASEISEALICTLPPLVPEASIEAPLSCCTFPPSSTIRPPTLDMPVASRVPELLTTPP